ncbi:hypothetical protein [Ferruginibacter lapsinanis]|nr:hypothetical protein [Ferruginibacter lapsinanis]
MRPLYASVTALFLLLSTILTAQSVGIGTTTPADSALVHAP